MIHAHKPCMFLVTKLYLGLYLWQALCAGGFPGGTSGKENPSANAGDAKDVGSIPGSGRSPRGGNGSLPKYSCLKNSMGRRT